MKKAILRWTAVLAAFCFVATMLAYWSYASLSDQYLASAFGSRLQTKRTLAGEPAVERSFRATFLPPRRSTPEGRLALLALRDFRGRIMHHHLLAVLIAQRLSQRYAPDELLALYADTIYLGNIGNQAVYGVREASRAYFNKDPEQLKIGEAAWLAGLAERPSFSAHPDRALEKRDQLIDRMVETHLITTAEADTAKREPAPARQ
ncbi:MAG TPA: transglycosylase domain-containing protein [Terriglobales bacterium]|nr:transglycosylase domain-containing protein [Terriglobales bacterium]